MRKRQEEERLARAQLEMLAREQVSKLEIPSYSYFLERSCRNGRESVKRYYETIRR
jgi:hypothetical protein